MHVWQKVFRDGFAPNLSTAGLLAVQKAIADDDPRLIQGNTAVPVPSHRTQYMLVKGADLIAFCGWQGDGLETVGDAEGFFANRCYECDVLLADPAGCSRFINQYDNWLRQEMLECMGKEVAFVLGQRNYSESDRLLDAVCENPGDWTLRLILADAYEEEGKQDMADCMRWMSVAQKRPYCNQGSFNWHLTFSIRTSPKEHPYSISEGLFRHVSFVDGRRFFPSAKEAELALMAAWPKAIADGWEPKS